MPARGILSAGLIALGLLLSLPGGGQAATLANGAKARGYFTHFQEVIAIVVTAPGEERFPVKPDFAMPMRSLTPAEFGSWVGGMEPAKESRFLPAGVSVYVVPRYTDSVTIEGSQAGVRAVISDPTYADGKGEGGGSGGEGGGY